MEAAGSAHVALKADSFHMNIEETEFSSALRSAAPVLRHIHLADNNRMAPGMGHLDLTGFLRTLLDIGYNGAIAMECGVQSPDSYGRNAFTTDSRTFDAYAKKAVATLKNIEVRLGAKASV